MITLLWLTAALAIEPAEPTDPEPPDRDTPEAVETIALELTEFTATPARITIPVDRKVRIAVTNAGTVTHSARIEALRLGTDALQPGETQIVEFVPRTAGSFRVTCGITGHDRVGEAGRLVVEASAPAREASREPEPPPQ